MCPHFGLLYLLGQKFSFLRGKILRPSIREKGVRIKNGMDKRSGIGLDVSFV